MMEPVELTRRWVKDMVIGLNLCPFAHVPFNEGGIRYNSYKADNMGDAHTALVGEVAEFLQLSAQEAETGLFIVSTGLEDFGEYLDVLEDVQAILAESQLDDLLQLASFHPDYCFEGLDENDPANYTNRSPFPMFHLIRQEGLAAALESCPDPASIPRRNIALLREMGLDAIRERLHGMRK